MSFTCSVAIAIAVLASDEWSMAPWVMRGREAEEVACRRGKCVNSMGAHAHAILDRSLVVAEHRRRAEAAVAARRGSASTSITANAPAMVTSAVGSTAVIFLRAAADIDSRRGLFAISNVAKADAVLARPHTQK